MSDFILADDVTGESIVVEGTRAEYFPLQSARFYNEVPVEQWFARPYPGDTRTEVNFIAPDAPLAVWGRVRRSPPSDGGIGAEEESRIVYDAARELLIVTEGNGSVVWSNRPLVGLLLILLSIGLAALLAFCAVTPGALDHP